VTFYPIYISCYMSLSQFIVYACPQGELAEQIQDFYQESLDLCGFNAAHNYMPHCTLTL